MLHCHGMILWVFCITNGWHADLAHHPCHTSHAEVFFFCVNPAVRIYPSFFPQLRTPGKILSCQLKINAGRHVQT